MMGEAWDLDKGKKIAATTLCPAENVTKQRAVNFQLTFVYMVVVYESIIYNKSQLHLFKLYLYIFCITFKTLSGFVFQPR